MPIICPMCKATHARVAPRPGTELVCAACDEPFSVPGDAGPAPRARAADAKPKKPPRSEEGAAPPGRFTGAPRRPRRSGDAKPRRAGNPPPRMAVIIGAGAVLLVVVLGAIGLVLAPMWKGKNAPNPADPGAPGVPAEPEAVGVPPFQEPANPFKAGTQVRLRELRAVPLPDGDPFLQLAHAPKHNVLFARRSNGVWAFDLGAGVPLGGRAPVETFFEFSLAPDQSALFASDYGGEIIGYKKPKRPSRVHRYDLAAKTWAEAGVPNVAYRIEAVDADRFLLLERDQHVDLTLNKWEPAGARELARIATNYAGDIEYDPRTGRVYHGNSGVSSQEITVSAVDGNRLKTLGSTGTYGTAQGRGGSAVLARDGARFYYGQLQVDAAAVRQNVRVFPEVVGAASRDIAFAGLSYYRVTDGTRLGDFEFRTALPPKDGPPHPPAVPPTVHVSPDGLSVWVIDRDKNVARQYALEGDK